MTIVSPPWMGGRFAGKISRHPSQTRSQRGFGVQPRSASSLFDGSGTNFVREWVESRRLFRDRFST